MGWRWWALVLRRQEWRPRSGWHTDEAHRISNGWRAPRSRNQERSGRVLVRHRGQFLKRDFEFAQRSELPVSRPRAGTLWRISPDFAAKSVWSHGMRNCYDFDFLPDGQIVTFDSDCERESALPWYRPTRVFVLAPGSDAGWCGQTWKDHDEHITMPQTIASLGRGSPTGVAVYTHNTFPSKYHGAAFVLDWTFGRVIAVMPSRNLPESQRVPNRIPAVNFMQTTGVNGFAPTDLCVANNGDLLVCTGGRGTKGAIYRVSPLAKTDSPTITTDKKITTDSGTDSISETDSLSSNPTENVATLFERALRTQRIDESSANLIAHTLSTPCPWDSWSEAQWRKNLLPKHYDMLLQIVTDELPIDCDESSAASLKLLAAQMLTRTGASVPTNAIIRAVSSPSPSSKLAGWWLVGRGVITNVQRDAIKIQGYASAAMIRKPKHVGAIISDPSYPDFAWKLSD